MHRVSISSSAPPWRVTVGQSPWQDLTEPLLADAPQSMWASYASEALAASTAPTATAHLPIDTSIRIGDRVDLTIDGAPVSGVVQTVEHVIRDGQAVTRIEVRVVA